MSEIPDALWESAFPDIPKPQGCTYWQFAAARDTMWQEEDREWTTSHIKRIEALRGKLGDEVVDEMIKQEMENL